MLILYYEVIYLIIYEQVRKITLGTITKDNEVLSQSPNHS